MRRTSLLVLLGAMVGPLGVTQVLAPAEILDPELRDLQQKHMADLKSVATAIAAHQFPFHFYLSRKLDISEEQEQFTDRRSIQFSRFRNQVVVQITGNYFAAYSAELMTKEDRARWTVTDVMVPILKECAANLMNEPGIQSFALEISHHVRRKALGVGVERTENVVLVLAKEEAGRLLRAATDFEQKMVVEHASVFVDGRDTALWPRDEAPLVAGNRGLELAAKPAPGTLAKLTADLPAPASLPPPPPPSVPAHVVTSKTVAATPDPLRTLQTSNQELLDRIVRDLDGTARFVGYAPPTFVTFHKGTYLQLSITTALPSKVAGSRYRIAALAFDEHIARLIRPLMAYFKEDPAFDGINFSTTIKTDGTEGGVISVEYVFGVQSLRCYEQYDCTGQQIINTGFVLINGERVGLDLQSAETSRTE